MLLHPAHAKTTFTNVQSTDYQPNAVDIRVEKLLQYTTQVVQLSEESKQHRVTEPAHLRGDGTWYLPPKHSFEIVFANQVAIAEGEAGWVVPRSTLNRNGISITSGLYDSGYNGVIGAVIHTGTAALILTPGTRIAQFVLVESQSKGLYNGSYGQGKEHDRKY